MNLTKERQTLEQVKSSILHKAQIIEDEYLRKHEGCKEFIFLYARAAEMEVQIVELLKEENKKLHPNLISAISCYIKSEEYLKAGKLLSKYYPKDSKDYSIQIIKELWNKVEDWYNAQDLNSKVIRFPSHLTDTKAVTHAAHSY